MLDSNIQTGIYLVFKGESDQFQLFLVFISVKLFIRSPNLGLVIGLGIPGPGSEAQIRGNIMAVIIIRAGIYYWYLLGTD